MRLVLRDGAPGEHGKYDETKYPDTTVGFKAAVGDFLEYYSDTLGQLEQPPVVVCQTLGLSEDGAEQVLSEVVVWSQADFWTKRTNELQAWAKRVVDRYCCNNGRVQPALGEWNKFAFMHDAHEWGILLRTGDWSGATTGRKRSGSKGYGYNARTRAHNFTHIKTPLPEFLENYVGHRTQVLVRALTEELSRRFEQTVEAERDLHLQTCTGGSLSFCQHPCHRNKRHRVG